jgi:hypothetical protein
MKPIKKIPALFTLDNELVATYHSIERLKQERPKYLKKGLETKVVILHVKNYRGKV